MNLNCAVEALRGSWCASCGRPDAGTDERWRNGIAGSAAWRGIDYWTLDEENAFIQYARQVLDVPLSAGISGTTTDLLECARIMGVRSENETFKYTMAVLGHLGAAGAHSFHEIMSAAAKAGIRYRQGDYTSLLQYDVPDTVRELFREKKYSKIAGIGTSLKG